MTGALHLLALAVVLLGTTSGHPCAAQGGEQCGTGTESPTPEASAALPEDAARFYRETLGEEARSQGAAASGFHPGAQAIP